MRLNTLPSFLFLASAIIDSPAQAQTYVTFTVPGAVFGTVAKAINDNGQITGWWVDAQTQHGFLRVADGTITTFDPPRSTYTVPLSINAAGAIAGYYYDASNHVYGFVRNAQGAIASFQPPGSIFVTGASINAAGQIAGSFFSAKGNLGFERQADGTIATFQVDSNATSANAIDNRGFIVGQVSTVPFVRDPAGVISLGNPVAGYSVGPTAINDKGTIAGNLAGGYYAGFTRPLHESPQFFEINGSFHTYVTGLNDSDRVVGYYGDSVERGFQRDSDGTVTLIDCPGYAQTQPYGINASGTVVGTADPGVDLKSFVSFVFTP